MGLDSRNMVFGPGMLGPATGGFALGSKITNGSPADCKVAGAARVSGGSTACGSGGGEATGTLFFSMLSRGFGLMEVYFGGHCGVSMISISSSSLLASSFMFCC
jgi:hypothetical protein